MSVIPDHAKNAIDLFNRQFADLSLDRRLQCIAREMKAPVFTTSLGKEDQAITSAIDKASNIRVVTLDTGRLFPETVALISQTSHHYGIEIEVFHPEPAGIAAYAAKYGLNGFYDSVEARHACCHLRKILPLKKALAGADGWITGLRRQQSSNRAEHAYAEWDAVNGLVKINPLVDWLSVDLDHYLESQGVPLNPLHQRGFPSIGCEPCTRAVKPGEDERAGRWWWEHDDIRECGLHVNEAANHAPADKISITTTGVSSQ